MQIIEINERNTELIERLVTLWEGAVKVSHHFLSQAEIEMIKPYVPERLAQIPHLIVAYNQTQPIAFIGIAEQKIEMLFVQADHFGQGIGKSLVDYAFEHFQVNEVVVNEQNPIARAFYERCGFAVYQRSEVDEQGNPYPILLCV